MYLEHQSTQQAQDPNCGARDFSALRGRVWRCAGYEEELWVFLSLLLTGIDCLWLNNRTAHGAVLEIWLVTAVSLCPRKGQPHPSPHTRHVRRTSGLSPSQLAPDVSGLTSSPMRPTVPEAFRSRMLLMMVCSPFITTAGFLLSSVKPEMIVCKLKNSVTTQFIIKLRCKCTKQNTRTHEWNYVYAEYIHSACILCTSAHCLSFINL